MSKKQQRRVSSGKGPAVKTGSSKATVLDVAAPQSDTPSSTSLRRAPVTTAEFKPDYTNVIKDLRRIGILAGSFIGILVILSFFLR